MRTFLLRSDKELRRALLLVLALSGVSVAALPTTSPMATRCGWFDNPTPGNATLSDRDEDWIISMQGAHQAKGPWPRFNPKQWVRTGVGSAGYGCACVKASVDVSTQLVMEIASSRPLPLSTCRKDPALRGKEPVNPLK
ncbi:MAG: DUF4087 domain-containing protein [Rhodoferax sp.]|nr:DUF4087 domain-containing protein [Rhodoferax sp.]